MFLNKKNIDFSEWFSYRAAHFSKLSRRWCLLKNSSAQMGCLFALCTKAPCQLAVALYGRFWEILTCISDHICYPKKVQRLTYSKSQRTFNLHVKELFCFLWFFFLYNNHSKVLTLNPSWQIMMTPNMQGIIMAIGKSRSVYDRCGPEAGFFKVQWTFSFYYFF